jgi:cyclopropane fatty-acyl-phospholipid synthase-like methyltransferase
MLARVLSQIVQKAQAAVLPRTRHGKSSTGVPLPPTVYRMGGKHFRSDEAFVDSATAEVRRLQELVDLKPDSRLLDWGCGAGRLAIGIAEQMGRIGLYHGVDIQKHLIDWAQRHLGSREGFQFTHVDLANPRYNPSGSHHRTIPGADGDYDAFYAYSVFSHLLSEDTAAYLGEVARLLRPGGKAFVTAFVEDGVEDEAENPEGYGPLKWSGPLHCVRFNRDFFEGMVKEAGLSVESLAHGQETDGQSLYILRKP